jgi:hypothetical protein
MFSKDVTLNRNGFIYILYAADLCMLRPNTLVEEITKSFLEQI